MPLTPIALFVSLAALVTIVSLPRDVSTGTKADDRATRPANPASPAPVARSVVHALARLEPEGGLVTVGVRPGVRIERILVKDGDQVSSGAVLAVLEGHDQAELQVALAEAQKKNADSQRSSARRKLDIERKKLGLEREREDKLKKDRLDAQEKVVELARRKLDTSKKIYETMGQAAQGKVKYELDLAYYQAEADSLKAQLELKELQIAQDLIDRRRRLEDEALADDDLDSEVFDRQISLAREGLDQTTVRAPAAGRVLEVTAHVGEVSSGPLLYMGNVSAMAAVAEVYQSDVPEVKVGDPAEAVIQGRKVPGKVTRIGRLVGKNTLASLDPRALQDRRVVPVTIRLDDPGRAADYVNMEVEVTIRPQPGGSQ
jgi:HlyD family secretion protein